MTAKEYKAEIARLTNKVHTLESALANEPDYTGKTGRITGTDSRYVVRVWFNRTSGYHMATITHVYPGQKSLCSSHDLTSLERGYQSARDTEEGRAIHDLLTEASRAARIAMAA